MAYLSVQAPTQSYSHTHSVKASAPAGMAKLGPASLFPPAEGEGGKHLALQKQAEGEKLAAGELARPGERSGRKAGKGFPGLYPGLMAALGNNPTQVGEP